MLDFLDNLRKKPLYVRKYIALSVSTIFSLLIFSIWVNSWGVKDTLPENTYTKSESPIAVVADKTQDAKRGLQMMLYTVRNKAGELTANIASSVSEKEAIYEKVDTSTSTIPGESETSIETSYNN